MNFDICEISEYEKDLVFFKKCKITCSLIFPKCFVALGKWGAGRSQFHIWTKFFSLLSSMFFDFFKSLIYITKSYKHSSSYIYGVKLSPSFCKCCRKKRTIQSQIKFSSLWKNWLLSISINWPSNLVNRAYCKCSLIWRKIWETWWSARRGL